MYRLFYIPLGIYLAPEFRRLAEVWKWIDSYAPDLNKDDLEIVEYQIISRRKISNANR